MPGIIENLSNLTFDVSAGTVSKKADIKVFCAMFHWYVLTLIPLVSRSFLDFCGGSFSLQEVIFRVSIVGKPVAKFKTQES